MYVVCSVVSSIDAGESWRDNRAADLLTNTQPPVDPLSSGRREIRRRSTEQRRRNNTANMSIEDNNDTMSCCASCGITEIDEIKLMECDGCDLVKYCSDECREQHKSEHEEDCKKRAAELREELLFKQPESNHMGDCPICSLPLPYDISKSTMYNCCSKFICDGCAHANLIREIEMRLQRSCPFCREPTAITEEDKDKQRMKRIEANDPVAMVQEGSEQCEKGEYSSAFECFTKAAALGDAGAHFQLSVMYRLGDGVEKEDGKETYHLEEAAIGGHPIARFNLASYEYRHGNVERAVKHLIIAATQGHDHSIKVLMESFRQGFVRKEDLTATLRAHKAAVDATKSPQRDEADKFEGRV